MRGCSDNVHFGSQVAQQLLDATEAGTDSVSMANLHNNEAGRVAVKRKMRYALQYFFLLFYRESTDRGVSNSVDLISYSINTAPYS